jgi:hypothetical protein
MIGLRDVEHLFSTTTLSHHIDHDNDDDTTTTTGADSGVAGAGPSSGLAEAVRCLQLCGNENSGCYLISRTTHHCIGPLDHFLNVMEDKGTDTVVRCVMYMGKCDGCSGCSGCSEWLQ